MSDAIGVLMILFFVFGPALIGLAAYFDNVNTNLSGYDPPSSTQEEGKQTP